MQGGGIRWLVAGQPIRAEMKVPRSDMSLVLNFWVPDQTWPWAYSPAIRATGPVGSSEWTFRVHRASIYTT